jgi:hypothetical protein
VIALTWGTRGAARRVRRGVDALLNTRTATACSPRPRVSPARPISRSRVMRRSSRSRGFSSPGSRRASARCGARHATGARSSRRRSARIAWSRTNGIP